MKPGRAWHDGSAMKGGGRVAGQLAGMVPVGGGGIAEPWVPRAARRLRDHEYFDWERSHS